MQLHSETAIEIHPRGAHYDYSTKVRPTEQPSRRFSPLRSIGELKDVRSPVVLFAAYTNCAVRWLVLIPLHALVSHTDSERGFIMCALGSIPAAHIVIRDTSTRIRLRIVVVKIHQDRRSRGEDNNLGAAIENPVVPEHDLQKFGPPRDMCILPSSRNRQ
jgi:hypothetical protein